MDLLKFLVLLCQLISLCKSQDDISITQVEKNDDDIADNIINERLDENFNDEGKYIEDDNTAENSYVRDNVTQEVKLETEDNTNLTQTPILPKIENFALEMLEEDSKLMSKRAMMIVAPDNKQVDTQNKVNLTITNMLTPKQIIDANTNGRNCFDQEDGHMELLDILHRGLPRITQENINVIIVGAGMSGLVAAELLQRAGYNVLIMEASDTIGGRVHTIRNVKRRWHGEMGPMRFPKGHYFTQYLLHKYRIPLTNFRNFENDARRYMNGIAFQDSNRDKLLNNDKFLTAFGIRSKDIRLGVKEGFKPLIEDGVNLILQGKFREAVDRYDHLNIRDLLVNKGFSSNAAYFIHSLWSTKYDRTLIYDFLEECVFNPAMEFTTISRGVDFLPRMLSLREKLDAKTLLNIRVAEVHKRHDGKLLVVGECAGTQCPITGPLYVADHVIMTPLPPVVRKIRIKPRMSVNKERAFRRITVGAASKIFIEFQFPFWERLGIFGGTSFTDLFLAWIVYPSYSFPSGVGILLASYSQLYDSRILTSMSQDEIKEQVLKAVAEVHNMPLSYIKSIFLSIHQRFWHYEPNFLGGWAYWEKYELSANYDALRFPQYDIHFAGDATEATGPWIDGAIKSGVRVAHEISMAYGNKPLQSIKIHKRRNFRTGFQCQKPKWGLSTLGHV